MDGSQSAREFRGELNVDEFLEHFGVRGMKWGVRRGGASKSSKPKARSVTKMSMDAVAAKKHKATAKKSSTDALSNKDLQALVTRMNLEQQYKKLAEKEGNTITKGQSAVRTVLGVVKTANDVYTTVNSPGVKVLINLLKTR